MKRPITILKKVLKEQNFNVNDLQKHPFNDQLYQFNLIGDLYYDLIQELKNNNFEIFRIRPTNKGIKVIVRVIKND